MQKVTICCDRCNREITMSEDPLTIQFWNRHCSQYNEDRRLSYDLCPECRKDFAKFLKTESVE